MELSCSILPYLFVLFRLIYLRTDIYSTSLYPRLTNVDEEGNLYGVSGGSGGYAEMVFRHAARAIYKREIEGPLDFKILRNSDFREITLEVKSFP